MLTVTLNFTKITCADGGSYTCSVNDSGVDTNATVNLAIRRECRLLLLLFGLVFRFFFGGVVVFLVCFFVVVFVCLFFVLFVCFCFLFRSSFYVSYTTSDSL